MSPIGSTSRRSSGAPPGGYVAIAISGSTISQATLRHGMRGSAYGADGTRYRTRAPKTGSVIHWGIGGNMSEEAIRG
jgi:hypothetical protein